MMRPGRNIPRWAQQSRTSKSNMDIFEAEAVIIEQRLGSPGEHATRPAPAPIRETRGGFGFWCGSSRESLDSWHLHSGA